MIEQVERRITMKMFGAIAITTLLLGLIVGVCPLLAGGGNDFPSGPHYELGIIGRPNTYKGGGTDYSNRHTIFIPLDTSGCVDGRVKLYMTQGSDFLVTDGDATGDGVAKFQIGPGYYAVFARAHGKPGGNINFTAWFTYWLDEGKTDLSDAIWMGNVDITRTSGKQQTVEISKLFYYSGTLWYDPDGTPGSGDEYQITYSNQWVFNILGFNEYWWDIDNNGLKRLEVRFYPVAKGYVPPPLP